MFPVERMRVLEVDNQLRLYNITVSGMEVYLALNAFK
jgi:hypothetical protein